MLVKPIWIGGELMTMFAFVSVNELIRRWQAKVEEIWDWS